ncbi:Variant surface glycoprotein, partial [Trypanosoma congolense IL3000]
MMKGVKYVLLFFLLWAKVPVCQAADKENAGEAEIFCQIRLLAENDPEKLVFLNEEREKQIMRHIEKVGPEIRSFVGEARKCESPIIARFNGIVKEAENLMGNVRKLRRKAAEKRLSAKRHLHQVIFGDYVEGGKGELDASAETINKIFSGDKFEQSCGGKGDKSAGKSLINDFICLCVSNTGFDDVFQPSKDESICKYGVDTAVKSDFSNWTAVWNFNSHRICINTSPLTPTPQDIHNLVELFKRAVEREQENSQVKGYS